MGKQQAFLRQAVKAGRPDGFVPHEAVIMEPLVITDDDDDIGSLPGLFAVGDEMNEKGAEAKKGRSYHGGHRG